MESADYCKLIIKDTTGNNVEPKIEVTDTNDTGAVDATGVWVVGANQAQTANFFRREPIDDIMHWDDVMLSDADLDDLARTNYGEAAYSFIVNVDKTDGDGLNPVTIFDSVTPINASFADPKGFTRNQDLGYSQVNMTLTIPAQVDLAAQERLDVYFEWQSPTATLEALEVDMKIDDSDLAENISVQYPSFMQITPPTEPFPTYFEHDPNDEFWLYVVNTGDDGVFFTYQGTRVSFNGTNGAYAGLIKTVNGTADGAPDCTPDEWYCLNKDRDSLHVPTGERAVLYFHEATDVPSTDESDGNLMVDGKYDTTIWLNGYSDQGESFLRSIYVGAVEVITPP